MDDHDLPLSPEKLSLTQEIENAVKLANLLDEFSARDLITALHWTNKADLEQCLQLQEGEYLEEYWDNLMKADKALQQFCASDLAKIIVLNKKLKQHER